MEALKNSLCHAIIKTIIFLVGFILLASMTTNDHIPFLQSLLSIIVTLVEFNVLFRLAIYSFPFFFLVEYLIILKLNNK